MAKTSLITAADHDFESYEGDTTAAILTFLNSVDSTPLNLAGASIKMEIRPNIGGLLTDTFSTATGEITITGAGNNIVTIKGWQRLTAGSYKYDLQVTIGADVRTYLKGSISVTQDVTE